MTDEPATMTVPPVKPGTPLVDRLAGLGDVGDIRTWLTVAIVLGFFGIYIANWWTSGHATGDPQETATKTLDLMNGALIAQFTGVVGYWIGSSRSSDMKTAALTQPANDVMPPTNTKAA